MGDVQGLGDHVGGALRELVLVVDHQRATVGHHDRVCAWERWGYGREVRVVSDWVVEFIRA